MGLYRIEIEAMGGHGCQREIKEGTEVYGCQRRGCPDCDARAFVEELKRSGQQLSKATLTHWPGEPNQVTDDLLTKKRSGNF